MIESYCRCPGCGCCPSAEDAALYKAALEHIGSPDDYRIEPEDYESSYNALRCIARAVLRGKYKKGKNGYWDWTGTTYDKELAKLLKLDEAAIAAAESDDSEGYTP